MQNTYILCDRYCDIVFFKAFYLRVSRHIGLLRVKGRKMNLQKIPLKTVRQFFIQDVVLEDFQDLFTPDTPQVTKKVEDLCYAKVKVWSNNYFLVVLTFLHLFSLHMSVSGIL